MLTSLQFVETKEALVNTRGLPEGKFTFTSHDSGDHNICLRTKCAALALGASADRQLHRRLVHDAASADAP